MKDLNLAWSEAAETVETLEDGIVLEHFVCGRDVTALEALPEVFGNPTEDARVWSRAESEFSDQAMCEKYAVEQLTGRSLSEGAVLSELESRGCLNRAYGTVRAELGCFAESVGLRVTYEMNLSWKELCESLENGEKILCPVSGIALAFPELADMPGLSPDRTVELIGIDAANPEEKRVILNDPFAVTGGSVIDYDTFFAAWERSGCFAAIISASED